MPQYDVIHKETGETQLIECSIHDIMEWYKQNPDWQRDWSQGCATAQEVGEWKDKLRVKAPGWNDVLDNASKLRGSVVTKL